MWVQDIDNRAYTRKWGVVNFFHPEYEYVNRCAYFDYQRQAPKSIEEFIGRVNSGTTAVGIARMKSPSGWSEPGQTPAFDEYTVVLRGYLHVKVNDATFDVGAGQAIIVKAGEWVEYSTPSPEGAEYIAVCLPAFSPTLVHRE